MLFEELLKDEYAKGKTEGLVEGEAKGIAQSILVFLSDLGDIPEDVHNRIMSEKNPDTLNKWLKLAVKVASLDDFLKQI